MAELADAEDLKSSPKRVQVRVLLGLLYAGVAELGRRDRFRFCFPKKSAGSIPVARIKLRKTMTTEQLLEEIPKTDVERLATILGPDSAAQKALENANSRNINCKFFVSKGKGSYSILVVPEGFENGNGI